MVIRTFFDRDNVIVYNNLINTGRNEIAELFYGGPTGTEVYSRYLFHFDETRLREFYSAGTFCDLTKLRHTLRMTNTGAFDSRLLGKLTCDGKARSCSFDLNLFTINQTWDEGNGYDYNECSYLSTGNGSVTEICPSNWVYAQTNIPWSGGNGVYSGSTSGVTIGIQHFEHGNENLEIDITDYVNGIITGATNNGLGLMFPTTLENLPTDEIQYVGFFTRHTQTFYEPFVESVYDNPIMDDRANFYLDKVNRLYLYSNIGGQPTELDDLPVVTILDSSGQIFTSMTASCATRGVYYVEFMVPTSPNYSDCMTFEDIWSNLYINGIARPDVELDFIVRDSFEYYNIGQNDTLPKKYGFNITGIKRDEKIKRGDIRRVNVSARIPYTINQTDVIDNLQYRLYVKEGVNQYTVIDYQDVNRTFNSNYFLLDTASLIPNTYYLDVKVESQNEVTTISEVLSFDIVSQSDLRISQ
jgi:hypothetical protein